MNKLARIFSLSTHAQERLAERSNLSAEEFLSLLNAGAYRRDDANDASAVGEFVHVYVNRSTNKPVPIHENTRAVLQALCD